MRNAAWIFFVLFAALLPLGCSSEGQSGSRASAHEGPARSTQQALTTVDVPVTGSGWAFGLLPTLGQSITAPATDTVLTTFSFKQFSGCDVNNGRVFRGEVYAWTGTQTTGPALYESGPTMATTCNPIAFNTGGVGLVAGGSYILFLSTAKDVSPGTGYVYVSSNSGNVYAGGNTFLQYSPSTPTTWSTQAWNNQSTQDLSFGATFDTAITTTTTIVSSKEPIAFGEAVTFTATVSSGGSTPGGQVTFKDGATSLGTATLDGAGKASLSTSALAVGTHSITAAYGLSGYFAASTSGALTQTVNKASTTSAITSSVNPTVVGGSTTFTATVTTNAPGTGTPAGSGVFRRGGGGADLGPGTLDASGKATLSTAALPVGSYDVFFDYAGNGSFAASQSPAVTQVVNIDGASVALTSSVNPSTFGGSTTFKATVTSVGSGGTPTGNVTFKSDGVVLGTVALAAGVAQLSTSALLGGTHTITAEYGGDAAHAAPAAGSLTQTVDVAASATTLVSLTPTSVFGQSVTLKATVTAGATGTVTFLEGGTTLGTGTLAGAQATLSIATLAVGSHSLTARYEGDTNYATSTSTAASQQVDKASTTTVVVSSSSPSIVGAAVKFTATVAPVAPGAGTPSGTVTFRDGGTSIGTGTLDASGIASLTTSALAVGSHSITADYATDASFLASSSAAITQTVSKDGVTTTVAADPTPSTFGATVTFTATVASAGTGGTPTGTVTFKDGAVTLGTGTLTAGVATYATSALLGGSHTITASYGGDTNHASGSTASLVHVVNPAATTTALTSSVNPSVSGQSITLTATVTSAVAGTATGTITFQDAGITLGTATVNAAGVATYTTSALSVSTHALAAVYSGDASYATSTGTLSQIVNKAATSTTVASSSNPSLIGTSVTFTATVTATAPGTGTPAGTVTFNDGATTLGTGTLSAAGVATYATTALAQGAHTITAAYGGGGNHTASTSAPLTQTVNAAAATIALTTAPNPSTFGATMTMTASVTGASGVATGHVDFMEGATLLGTAMLDGAGKAALPVATLAVGMHTLEAHYSGDAIYASGVGTASQVVGKAATTTTVASSLNPSTVGAAVTLTATVASSAMGFTGSVEFFDGTTSLGVVTLAGGSAAITTAALVEGGRSVTATYSGDVSFAASTSTGLTQTVNAKPVVIDTDAGVPPATDAGAPGDSVIAPADSNGGCGCTIQGSSGTTGGLGLLFALAGVSVVAVRRRRRA